MQEALPVNMKQIHSYIIQNDWSKNFGRQIKEQICYKDNVIVLKPNTSWNLFNIFSKDFAACLVIQSPLFWGWRALFSTSMSLVEKDLFVQKLFSLGWFFEKAAALPLEIFRQTNRSYQYFSKYKLVLNQILRFLLYVCFDENSTTTCRTTENRRFSRQPENLGIEWAGVYRY